MISHSLSTSLISQTLALFPFQN